VEIGSPSEILPVIESAWRRRQAESWAGDPAATWEWISEAARDARTLLLIGSPGRPLACLRVAGGRRFGVAVPPGRHLDRFAPCPGTTPDELVQALVHAPKTIPVALRLVESRIADAAAAMPAVVRRGNGEFAIVRPQSWSDYYAARSQKLRWTLKRGRSKFAALPGAEMSELADGETRTALPELAAVESHGHRGTRVLDDGFVVDVIARLDASGAVLTHVARIDGRIVAYALGFVSPTRFVGYTMGFRSDLAGLSLGSLLLAAQIQSALENGREVDLGQGFSDFKDRFAEARHPLWDVFVLPRSVAAGAGTAIRARKTIRSLRRQPKLRP
jgi:GNAT acetyltransferase-like protein